MNVRVKYIMHQSDSCSFFWPSLFMLYWNLSKLCYSTSSRWPFPPPSSSLFMYSKKGGGNSSIRCQKPRKNATIAIMIAKFVFFGLFPPWVEGLEFPKTILKHEFGFCWSDPFNYQSINFASNTWFQCPSFLKNQPQPPFCSLNCGLDLKVPFFLSFHAGYRSYCSHALIHFIYINL